MPSIFHPRLAPALRAASLLAASALACAGPGTFKEPGAGGTAPTAPAQPPAAASSAAPPSSSAPKASEPEAAPAAKPAGPAPDASAKPAARLAVLGTHRIGGEGGWDYLTVDPSARRLYLAHTNQIDVIDLETFEALAAVTGLDGAHGVAVAPELGKAFATSGRDGAVLRFDTKTLLPEGKLEVGRRPDAIAYEPKSDRVFAMLGGDKEAVAIDPATFKVVGRVALKGKPEFAVAMGGKLFVNLEDVSELAVLDPVALKLTARHKLAPCTEPSGLAADPAHDRLMAVCDNNVLVSIDGASGKVLGSAKIGDGTDGVAFDSARGLALASNGDGSVSVIGFNDAGAPQLLETLPTKAGARTIAFDPKSGHAFTVTADMGKPDGEHKRGAVVPGTLTLYVLGAPR